MGCSHSSSITTSGEAEKSRKDGNPSSELDAKEACKRMARGLSLVLSGATPLRRRRRRRRTTGEEKEENNKSWLLADAAAKAEGEGEGEGEAQAQAQAQAEADPQSVHSSFRFSFDSQVEMEEPTTADSAATATILLLVNLEEDNKERQHWRRLESLERSISPVAGGLVRFSYAEIRSATRDFCKGRELGRGALSRVYRGRVGEGRRRRVAAIKRLGGQDKECAKAFCRELMIASSLQNPNVVPLLGFCVDKEGLFLVYKYVSGGSLDHHLHHQESGGKGWRGKVLPWEVRYKVAMGVARAVEYLHCGTDKCVIHRDIKPSNILLSSNKSPKLCDFGLATWTDGPSLPFLCKAVKGTFGYLAPEYFQHGKLSDKTDVYAFGVVLLELITGRKAIDQSKPQGDENLVLWNDFFEPKCKLDLVGIYLNHKICGQIGAFPGALVEARPLLQRGEGAMEELVDPRLRPGSYSWSEMSRMLRVATVCVNYDESGRPSIDQVIGMLQGEESCNDWSVFTGISCLAGYDPQLHDPLGKSEMRGHIALAMLGVSDTEEDDMYGR